MKCPNCRYVYEKDDLSYCVQCGHFVGKTCPDCKEETKPGSTYCGSCGGKLNPTEREKELTDEFAKYLKGTKQTFQYWGYALIILLILIGGVVGIGKFAGIWESILNKAANEAKILVDNKVKELIEEDVRVRLKETKRNTKRDKAYVNLRIAKALSNVNNWSSIKDNYKITRYKRDIRYWLDKAEELYKDLHEKKVDDPQILFELGRINYVYPVLFGANDMIDYDRAKEYFVNALKNYNDEQRKKGWDREANYYLGNIYYDLWYDNEIKDDMEESIEYFKKALAKSSGKLKLNKKFVPYAKIMLNILENEDGVCKLYIFSFAAEGKYLKGLNTGNITKEIRKLFKNEGYPLPENPIITKEKDDKIWQIKGKDYYHGELYYIIKDGNIIHVACRNTRENRLSGI